MFRPLRLRRNTLLGCSVSGQHCDCVPAMSSRAYYCISPHPCGHWFGSITSGASRTLRVRGAHTGPGRIMVWFLAAQAVLGDECTEGVQADNVGDDIRRPLPHPPFIRDRWLKKKRRTRECYLIRRHLIWRQSSIQTLQILVDSTCPGDENLQWPVSKSWSCQLHLLQIGGESRVSR